MIPIGQIFYNRQRKLFLLILLIYYPGLSLTVGAPIPFPSIVDVSEQQIAFFNFASLLITLIGSAVGVGFYLERRGNLKIEKLEEKIEEMGIANREEMKEIKKEAKETEKRIQEAATLRGSDIERNVELKVQGAKGNMELKVQNAKEIVDTKFERLEDAVKGLQKAVDFIQQVQFGSGSKMYTIYVR